MSLNFCDLLVLGSDLSGVMTATLLAKRGMNVLVLDDEDEREPVPNLATGLSSRSFKSLLGKLMIPDSKLQILHENAVGCQVVFPRHRLDLYRSRPLFFKEIEREFPQEKPLLEDLISEVDQLRENYLDDALSFFPVDGLKEKKRFIRWMQNFPDSKLLSLWNQLSPTLQCFLKVQLRFFSRSPLFDPPLFQLLLFLPPESDSSFSIKGGTKELKRLFFDKLDYFGGMVHPLGEEAFQVLTKGREIRGIQLARYNFPTRCRFLLGNMNVQKVYDNLPNPFFSFLFGRTRQRVEALVPEEERCVVQYEVPKESLPAPMKENVVFVSDPTAPLVGSNYLEINLHPLAKPTHREDPQAGSLRFDTLLTVSYTVSGEDLPLGPSELTFQKINDEIDSKLHRLIPFSNSHLQRTFPARPGSEKGDTTELFPPEETPLLLEKIARKRVSYPPSFFIPTLSSPFKNLFVLGPNLLDWLGMEGKMLAALRAVEMIWAGELKVRNP